MIFATPVHFTGHALQPSEQIARENLDAHHAHYGLETQSMPALLEAIEKVELSGRGGGHFPVSRKLAPLVKCGADAVVINGSEGETLSSKDAALLQLRPHLVLDGAQSLARITRANRIVVWLHEGANASLDSIQRALNERELDSTYSQECVVQIMLGPARYLTGEASSVIAGVRGGPVLPRFISDPAKPWVDGDAVLVHNVETHARIGLLLHLGASGYRPSSLVTIARDGEGRVVEVLPDTTFAALFQSESVQAPRGVLLGGFGGTWYPWARIREMRIEPGSLKALGVAFGTGIIAMPPTNQSELKWSAEILSWMANESAGQCGPCIFGLPELAFEYQKLASSRVLTKRKTRKLEDTMRLIEGRGACRHPDGVVRMARSAIALTQELQGNA